MLKHKTAIGLAAAAVITTSLAGSAFTAGFSLGQSHHEIFRSEAITSSE